MRFSTEFLDEIRSRVSLTDTVARKVRLTRRGKEHVGLCPFHNEKTPSFTVNEAKGFYHCFGCGAHGDVFRFLTETENLPFPEAVERLAAQAGLPMPQMSAEEREQEKKRASLYDVMEAAAKWYESQLSANAGQGALAYLKDRGLTDGTISHFSLGFAPARRTALRDALLARDITEAQLVDAGLAIKPDDGGEAYDRFRDRIMFPIRDNRERVIAFGGRAMSKEARAKYLNSPDTPLFHKGRTLYNIAPARKAAHERDTIIVAEGYMDVIALHQAGFPHSVAPLGTAVTEEQIQLLWRMAAEPVLCFDGDEAGERAAVRTMQRALPLLRPGVSLRFCLLPEGEDPDSLIQKEGPRAFARLMQAARTLADLLWAHLTGGVDISTPERRAGLEKNVLQTVRAIGDENVRRFYERDFRNRLFEMMRPMRRGMPGKPRFREAERRATGGLARTALGRSRGEAPVREGMEALILLTVLNHPELLISHMEGFAELEMETPDFRAIQNEIVDWAGQADSLDIDGLKSHLLEKGFETLYTRLTQSDSFRSVWSAQPDAAPADAEKGWLHTLGRYRQMEALRRDRKATEAELARNWTEEGFERLKALNQEIDSLAANATEIEGYGLASGRQTPA